MNDWLDYIGMSKEFMLVAVGEFPFQFSFVVESGDLTVFLWMATFF